MTELSETASLAGGVALLERAINYALGSLHAVTPQALSRPTPCRDWDLRALLWHVDDSLTALYEAADLGAVALGGEVPAERAIDPLPAEPAIDPLPAEPAIDPLPADPVATVRRRASRLLGAWASAVAGDGVTIAGYPLTMGVVTSVGAVEVAVHGWDIARACGLRRSIPPPLAEEMLQLASLFVTELDRPVRFAAPVRLPPLASSADRLVAFLGRQP